MSEARPKKNDDGEHRQPEHQKKNNRLSMHRLAAVEHAALRASLEAQNPDVRRSRSTSDAYQSPESHSVQNWSLDEHPRPIQLYSSRGSTMLPLAPPARPHTIDRLCPVKSATNGALNGTPATAPLGSTNPCLCTQNLPLKKNKPVSPHRIKRPEMREPGSSASQQPPHLGRGGTTEGMLS